MDKVHLYFNGEITQSTIFILVGIAAIAAGLFYFFSFKSSYHYGISSALILIALIQVAVGTAVIIRSPKDIARVDNYYKSEPEKFRAEEIPRMNAVMKNFEIIKWIEIALIIAGLLLFFIMKNYLFIKGFGIGLTIQAAISLLMDYFAELRAYTYLEHLKNLIN